MKWANYLIMLTALLSIFMVTEFAWKTELVFQPKPECVDGSAKLISYNNIVDCLKGYHRDLIIVISVVFFTAISLILFIVEDEKHGYLNRYLTDQAFHDEENLKRR